MTDADSTVTVEVVLRGRRATIEDVQGALDTLRSEGIPDTFEVTVVQSEERIHEEDVPYRDQKREHCLRVHARRAATS